MRKISSLFVSAIKIQKVLKAISSTARLSKLFIGFAGLMLSTVLNAQIGVTVTGNTNTTPNLAASYTSFASAVTALNGVTAMTGPVVFTLEAGASETAPVKGFAIGSATLNPVLSSSNTITIIKATGAATTINAGVGTSNGASATPDGMLYLNGADFVTIDGLTFTDGNTASATVAMEFGIALFKRSAGDGCNNNTIQNCIFNMQRINNSLGTAPMGDGSTAILVVNSTAAAATTPLTPTNGGTLATNGTNSNNKFYSNTINGGNSGIYLSGFAASTGVGPSPTATSFLGDIGNDVGGASSSTGNTILNFGGGASSNPAVGIRANNQWSVNISYNTIDNNNGSGVNHASALRGIYAQAGTSAAATISNNTVTVRSGATTSQLIAIDNAIGSTAASNTISINNNTIRFSYTTATSGVFTGIAHSSTAAIVNINNNNIQQLASTNYPSTNTINVINTGSSSTNPGILNVNNNTISNFNMTAASGTLRGIIGYTPTGLFTCSGNTIENISYTSATSTGSITGIYNISSATLQSWNNNIIRNLSTPGSGTLNGIQNNTVAGTFTCTDNLISGFSTTAGGAGGFSANGIILSNSNVVISGNTISNIVSTGTSGGTGGTINGISLSTGSGLVFNNKVFNLSSNSSNPVVAGISSSGATASIYNNLIGHLSAPSANNSNAVIGLNITGGTTATVSFNTVYINGLTSVGALFGASGIFSSTSPNLILRNNVIRITGTANGAANIAAYRRSSLTASTYSTTSNNNAFFAGSPSATNLIYVENTSSFTNPMQTMGEYKAFMGTRDQASVSIDPSFQSTVATSADFLKYVTTSATPLEAGGIPVSGITTDYAGTTRNVTTPDMGAWELNGIPLPACAAPTAQPTGLTLTPTTTSVSLSFTAAAGNPDNYLIIRTTSSTPPQDPVDGTSYSVGASALSGTIVFAAASTSTADNAATAGTQYWYWVYSFNQSATCAGPVYNRTSPLSGTTTTCVLAPTAAAASNITGSGFTANWAGNVSATYTSFVIDVSTTNAFSSFVTGYNALNVGNVTATTVTGLSPLTNYFYRVRGVGSGCFTNNTSVIQLNTNGSVPWTEGFSTSSNAAPPVGWSAGFSSSSFQIGVPTGASGNTGNVLTMNLYSSAPSGTFSLPTFSNLPANAQFSFTYKIQDYSSPYAVPTTWGNFQFQISVNGGSFTNLGSSFTAAPANFLSQTISLASFAGSDIRIRLNATRTAGDFWLMFDDFSILAPCSVPAVPTALVFGTTGPGNVAMSFTPNATTPNSYMVVRYPAGSAETAPTNAASYSLGQSIGLGTVSNIISGTVTSVLVSGLSPSTAYDFYIYPFNNVNCLGGPVFAGALSGTQSTSGCPVLNPSISIGASGATYTSLNELSLILNGCPVSSPTVVTINPDYNPAGETYPIIFNNNTGASLTNTITIQPAGTVTSVIVLSASNTSPLLDLSGARHFIFDGRPGGSGVTSFLTVDNTGDGSALRLTGDAQNNIIRYIRFRASNTSATSGVVRISTAGGVGLSNGNNNNTITNCDIDGKAVSPNGIYAVGSAAPADNKSNTISNNNIFNYYADPTGGVNNYGILLGGNNAVSSGAAWTISGNSFYQTATRNYANATGSQIMAGIGGGFTPAGAHNIIGNFFGGTLSGTGGTPLTITALTSGTPHVAGIHMVAGTGTTTISGNTFANMNITTGQTSTNQGMIMVAMIDISGATASSTTVVRIDNNTIGSTTAGGSIVYAGGASSAWSAINVGSFYSSQLGARAEITNNTIAGLTFSGGNSTTFRGINISSSLGVRDSSIITGNTIGASSAVITMSGSGSLTGIINSNSRGALINNNIIRHLQSTNATSSPFIIGINAAGGNATSQVAGNQISNLSTTAVNTSTTTSPALAGIQSTVTLGRIERNIIFGLTASGNASVSVHGIYNSGSVPQINANSVSDLFASSVSATGSVMNGIYANGGTSTFSNNLIRLGVQATPVANLVNGIADVSGTNSYFYNSVFIGGAGVGTAASNTFAFNSSNTGTRDIRNNIFMNARSNASTGGKHYAISMASNSGYTINNNDYYVTGTGGVLGVFGSSADITSLSAWRTATGQDLNSINYNPFFTAATAATPDLTIDAANPSLLEGSAGTVSSVTVDYAGVTRSTTTPDIGAYEFSGTALSIPVINTLSATAATCSAATSHVVTVNVTPGATTLTGSMFTLNYAFNGTTQTPTTNFTNAGSGNWTATIPAATPANAVVTWSVSINITDANGAISVLRSGSSYQDNPELGITAAATATPTTVCLGSNSSLSLQLNLPGSGTFGSSSTTSTSAGANPFYGGYGGVKTQYIIRASELLSAGFSAGNITSLGIDVTSVGATLSGFAISLGHTTLADLTTSIEVVPSQVYSANFTPVLGINTFTFSSPFNWDGVSNVIISFCWSNNNSSNTTSTVRVNNPGFTSSNARYVDNRSSSDICTYTGSATPAGWNGTSTTSTSRPNFIIAGNKPPTPSSYSWSNGSSVVGTTNPLSTPVSATTSYTGTAYIGGCPIVASPVTVTTIALPSAPTATGSTQCGTQVPLASVADQNGFTTPTFRWYANTSTSTALQSSTATTYTGTVAATTTFHVAVVHPTTGCESLRTPVTVTVDQPNSIAATATPTTLCLGNSTNLTVTQTGAVNNYVLTWSLASYTGSGLAGPVSGTLNTALAVTPTATGTYVYTVTGVESATGCQTTANVSVLVNPIPPAFTTLTATPASLCNNQTVALAATISGGTSLVSGTATTTNSSTTYPTPFGNYYYGARQQFMFTAAELNAMGITRGNLTAVAFDIAAAITTPLTNYTISAGTLTASALSSAFVTGLQPIFTRASYTPSSNTGYANNKIVFDVPFLWNGTSNVVFEICFNNSSYTDNATTNYTATSYVSCVYYRADASGVCSNASVTGTSSNRPNMQFDVDYTPAYNWSWNTAPVLAASSGSTTAVNLTAGSISQTYSATATIAATGCSRTAATPAITIHATPALAPITGTAAVCVGNTTALTSTTTGGVWSTSSSAIASVSSTGVVTGVAAGTATITYSLTDATTGCVNSVTRLVTVNALPVVSAISGTASVCVGLTTPLSSTPTTGVWSSANTTVASVNTSGVVSGIAAGTSTISYTVTDVNSCVTTVTRLVTVNPLPVVPAITGSSAVCISSTITLANTVSGGVWTTSNSAIATVSASGVVTGVAAGTATITYTVTSASGCITAVTRQVTVNLLPSVTGVLTQPITCVSDNGAINITAGGPAVGPYTYAWSTPNGSTPVATAEDQTGLLVGQYDVVVTAANGCTVTGSYTLVGPGGCDICPTISTMAASPNPPCVGSNTTLTASGLIDMGVTFGIVFKYSTTPLTNPYTQGTVIQTVPNSSLTGSGTQAATTISFPAPGTYYVYSIVTPLPLTPNCRPFKSATITVEALPTVSAVSNQIVSSSTSTTPVVFSGGGVSATYSWTNSNTAVYPFSGGSGNISAFFVTNTGTSPQTSTIAVSATNPNSAGQACTGPASNFTVTVNPAPTMVQPTNYTFVNAVSSTAINFATVNTGGTTTYAWTNSNAAIGLAASGTGSIPVFTPVNTGTSPITVTISVTPSYTNANGGPTSVGAKRDFTITINPTAQVNTVANQFICTGASVPATVFATANTGGTTTYAWTNDNPAIGLAASGTGSLPAFTATNTQAGAISATITVTPTYTNAGLSTPGAPATFVITVNPVGQVNTVLNQALCTGSTTTAVNFSTTNLQGNSVPGSAAITSGTIAVAIPDNSPAGVTSTLPVSLPTTALVTGVRVTLNATHTWIGDLVINLRAPNGQVLNLFNRHGGSGDNLVNTVISSAGTASLASGTAPFTGTFAATAALNVGATGQNSGAANFSALYGTGSGDWVLSLRDMAGLDVGTLTGWSLDIDYTTLQGGLTTYNWTNSAPSIGLAASGTGNIAAFTASNATSAPIVSTVTVTPTYTSEGFSCAGGAITYTYTVNPTPTVNTVADQVFCAGTPSTVNFSGATTGTVYNWTSSNAAIGLAVSGTGNLSFTPTNTTTAPISSTITVTPVFTNAGVTCTGTPRTFTITVNPVGQVNAVNNQLLCNGANTTPVSFATVNTGATTTYAWTNNTPSIGLAASGVGNIASFAAANTTAVPVTATVTVTPTYTNGGVGCAGPASSFTYTVNPTPTVNAVSSQAVCVGSSVAAVTFGGTVSGTVYNWTNSNTAIGLAASGTGNIASFVSTNTTSAAISGTITVTPVSTINGITCTGTPRTFTITVNPIPTVNAVNSFPVCHNSTAAVTFSGATTGTMYSWTNSTPGIGLAASGTGNISFTALNTTSAPIVATIVVTPSFANGGTICTGVPITFTITVNPLPVVSAGTLPARICISDTLVMLTGTPVGGSWSGIGTSGMNFVPTATAVGTWPITYTFADINGCVNRATIAATVLSCDERDRDLDNSAVLLYPNPNSGQFNLRINSTRFNALGMRVYTTTGQLVSTKQWSALAYGRVLPVDLSNLPAGIYMVRLYYGDGMDRGADKTYQVIIAR